MEHLATEPIKRRLTLPEVAEIVGVSVRTLRDQRLRGEGIGSLGYRLDSRILFDQEDVEQYISEARERHRIWQCENRAEWPIRSSNDNTT